MKYQVVEESHWDQENGRHIGYGVCAYRMRGRRKEELAHISDVFLSLEAAQDFVARCNRLELDLIHLPDAIEDALNGDATCACEAQLGAGCEKCTENCKKEKTPEGAFISSSWKIGRGLPGKGANLQKRRLLVSVL